MENVLNESNRCLQCLHCLAESSCPAKIKIKEILGLLKEGKVDEASDVLYSVNPFPELTSALCDTERQCLGNCILGNKNEPVDFPSIEAHLASIGHRFLGRVRMLKGRLAFVGAGPANLTTAYYLLRRGWNVDFFEKNESLGGAILNAIPDWRFDKNVLKNIESDLKDLGGVFHYGCDVGSDITLAALEEEFDGVVLGIGTEKENFGNLPRLPGIYGGLDFLRYTNEGHDFQLAKDSPIYVWGGGNVALDCARTAKRLFGNATILYRRGLAEMPGNPKEIRLAQEEGVNFAFLTNVKSVKDDEGRLSGIEIVKMQLGEPDSSGRRKPVEVEGSETEVPAECLILAIGQKSILSSLDRRFENATDIAHPFSNIYVNGDCRYGPKNIAAAITSGRELADLIDKTCRW